MPRPGESLPASSAPLAAGPLSVPSRGRPARGGRLRASLSASIAEGAAAEVFAACAGGAVLTGWPLYLGASPLVIGLLGALPLAAQVVQVPAAWLTQRLGPKPLAVVAIGAARLVWLPLITLPFLDLPSSTALALFVAVIAAAAVLGVVGNNAWTTWMGDLVPGPIRGRFFGRRTVYLSIAGTVASLGAAVALDTLAPRGWTGETLAALAAVACGAGIASLWLLRRQQAAGVPAERTAPEWRAIVASLRDRVARPYLVYQFGWNAAVGLSASFFSFHMLATLETGFVLAAAHGIVVAVVRIVSAPVGGHLVDRFGGRPVIVLCSFGIALVPAIWLFATPGRLWPIALEAIVSGALWSWHGIAAFDLSIDLAPRRERPFYLAAFATAAGIGFALASSLAGLLASTAPARFDVLGASWTPVHLLFLMSALARASAAGLALRIDERRARTVPDLVREIAIALPRPWLPRADRRASIPRT
ncbi:MAG: MFS transporter [Candidatus Rokubacteria bacterium]|nr:MFS transporter [Candidatus Rokubacteria bacterium]